MEHGRVCGSARWRAAPPPGQQPAQMRDVCDVRDAREPETEREPRLRRRAREKIAERILFPRESGVRGDESLTDGLTCTSQKNCSRRRVLNLCAPHHVCACKPRDSPVSALAHRPVPGSSTDWTIPRYWSSRREVLYPHPSSRMGRSAPGRVGGSVRLSISAEPRRP